MYLPPKLPNARVLITVKTYPKPSSTYGELVCTAGLFQGEKWIRIYPIPFRFLQDSSKYPKYGWVQLDLIRNTKDFRPESYRPRRGIDEDIQIIETIDTANNWAARKHYILQHVYTSMEELIALARSEQKTSLATLQPAEIVNFVDEEDDRQWKEKWLAQSKQGDIFELNEKGQMKERELVRKLPYKYSYEFLTEGDTTPRKLKIEDWEIGALFWNCLRQTDGDDIAANRLVRQKYFDTFVQKKELYFFLGTTKQYHHVGPNPFVIVGVFYPPKTSQMSLFLACGL
jgi:hypothetical protein